MDDYGFDRLTRAFSVSRRGAIRTLIGGLVAGLGGHAAASGAVAKPGKTPRPPKPPRPPKKSDPPVGADDPFYRVNKSCRKGETCGDLTECRSGVCVPNACFIDDETYAPGASNPATPCLFCIPTADVWTDWLGVLGDGEPCEHQSDNPCLAETGTCLGAVCIPGPLPDGELCGSGQVCCRGVCCGPTECCNGSGRCEECGPHCTIDGGTHADGAANPDGSCLACDADFDPFFWSGAPDSMPCGPNRDQVCCSGVCCADGSCCGEDGVCTTGCDPACTIDEIDYDARSVNTANACQFCDPDHSTTSWSMLADDAPCESPPGGHCCGGVCCSPGECCNLDGQCDIDCAGMCRIEGTDYADGVSNPMHACQVCDADRGTTSWWTQPDGWTCGNDPYRVCCGGTCCGPDECCTQAGQCGACCDTPAGSGKRLMQVCETGCTIDGVFYADGTISPASACQTCNVSLSATSWTSGLDNLFCDPNDPSHSGRCCGGVCCAIGACCNADGACQTELGFCGCGIGGVNYRANQLNPANDCEACAPDLNSTGWTAVCSDTCCAPLRCIHDGGSHCG